uniref:Uncharacterized protein n=1 Tax=Anguilla anguilla TaxID=7936 RepID=A0A0E9XJD0_ANGAN
MSSVNVCAFIHRALPSVLQSLSAGMSPDASLSHLYQTGWSSQLWALHLCRHPVTNGKKTNTEQLNMQEHFL